MITVYLEVFDVCVRIGRKIEMIQNMNKILPGFQ